MTGAPEHSQPTAADLHASRAGASKPTPANAQKQTKQANRTENARNKENDNKLTVLEHTAAQLVQRAVHDVEPSARDERKLVSYLIAKAGLALIAHNLRVDGFVGAAASTRTARHDTLHK